TLALPMGIAAFAGVYLLASSEYWGAAPVLKGTQTFRSFVNFVELFRPFSARMYPTRLFSFGSITNPASLLHSSEIGIVAIALSSFVQHPRTPGSRREARPGARTRMGSGQLPSLASTRRSTSMPSNWMCGKIDRLQWYQPILPSTGFTSSLYALK